MVAAPAQNCKLNYQWHEKKSNDAESPHVMMDALDALDALDMLDARTRGVPRITQLALHHHETAPVSRSRDSAEADG